MAKKKVKSVEKKPNGSEETPEDSIWAKGSFTQTISGKEAKEMEKTINMGHSEDMRFNCKKCGKKISAHNKDWHDGMCDKCFNRQYFPDEEET